MRSLCPTTIVIDFILFVLDFDCCYTWPWWTCVMPRKAFKRECFSISSCATFFIKIITRGSFFRTFVINFNICCDCCNQLSRLILSQEITCHWCWRDVICTGNCWQLTWQLGTSLITVFSQVGDRFELFGHSLESVCFSDCSSLGNCFGKNIQFLHVRCSFGYVFIVSCPGTAQLVTLSLTRSITHSLSDLQRF